MPFRTSSYEYGMKQAAQGYPRSRAVELGGAEAGEGWDAYTPPSPAANEAYAYARRLLVELMLKHYPDRSPDWKPLPDLLGVLTQIDNLTTGLVRKPDPVDECMGKWLAAALDDPNVCKEMKADIEAWLTANRLA